MADSAVIIEVDMNESPAQKKIDRLKQRIDRLQSSLDEKKSEQSGIKEKLVNAQNAAIATEREIERLKKLLEQTTAETKGNDPFSQMYRRQIAENEQLYAQQDEAAAKLGSRYEKITDKVAEMTSKLDDAKSKCGEMELELLKSSADAEKVAEGIEKAQASAEGYAEAATKSAGSTDAMAEGIEKTDKSAKGFASRMKKLAASALVFSVITQALRGFRDWIGDVVKATPEASAAVAKLKGALLTMVQPLVNVIIPAFTTLVNVLTAVVGKLAEVFAFLSGTTVESSAQAAEALNAQTEALNGTGSAAKKASKSLASFDEINKLSNSESSGGGAAIQADFTGIGDMTFLTDRLQTVAEDIKTIFSDVKSFISNIFSGDWGDAIQNIMDFCNDISQLLRDLVATADDLFGNMVDGIIEKFGLAGTPIGEMLEGIKGMVHNTVEMINDIVDENWGKLASDFGNFLDSFRRLVNGILELGKKVISSLLDWLDEKTHGRFSDIIGTVKQFVIGMIDSVKQIFNGLTDFLIGVFTGDWKRMVNGLQNIWIGFVNGIITAFEGTVNIIITAINWVTSQINSLLSISVPEWVPKFGGMSWSPDIQPIPLKQFGRIPALAQGAVIPPNREFLAVLGDQKSGTNIETPLPTMIQAFKQAMAEMNLNGQSEAYLMLDDIQLGKVIYRLNKAEGNRIGVSLVGV